MLCSNTSYYLSVEVHRFQIQGYLRLKQQLFFHPADKIAEGEFIQGVMDNKDILRLIQYDEPQKIKDKLKEKRQ